jgi:lactoylglutathione lyase
MKYLWTTIHVKNMDESIHFYSDLIGLQVMQRFPAGPGVEIAFMGNGVDNETLVELYSNCNNDTINYSEFISIGFAVDSVDTTLDIVRSKNIPIHNEPFETPKFKWFTIKDPNGLNIQFFQQK